MNPKEVIPRRRFIGFAAGTAGLAAIAACRAPVAPNEPASSRKPDPKPAEPVPAVKPTLKPDPALDRLSKPGITTQKLSVDEEVVYQEVARRGLKSSDRERLLWLRGYPHSAIRLPVTKETTEEAKQRMTLTRQLMRVSGNNLMKEAEEGLTRYEKEGIVTVEAVADSMPGQEDSAGGIVFIVKDGKFHIRLEYSVDSLLNYSNSSTLAMQLVHEFRHISNALKRQESLPKDWTGEQRRQYEISRARNPDAYLTEEADGYAQEARAYLIHYGLGFRGLVGQQTEAAQLIRCKDDATSACWKNFIQTEILDKKRLRANPVKPH